MADSKTLCSHLNDTIEQLVPPVCYASYATWPARASRCPPCTQCPAAPQVPGDVSYFLTELASCVLVPAAPPAPVTTFTHALWIALGRATPTA